MLTCPPNPRKHHLPGRKTSPGRTHQIGNILHGLQAAQMPQTRVGEATGLSHGLEADSHGENQALAQLEQGASRGQRQMRLSGQPRAWMPARASGLTLEQEGFPRAAVGWMAPGALATGGRAGPAQPQPRGPEYIGCMEFEAQPAAFTGGLWGG